jgi:FixJ family two-component response regulator
MSGYRGLSVLRFAHCFLVGRGPLPRPHGRAQSAFRKLAQCSHRTSLSAFQPGGKVIYVFLSQQFAEHLVISPRTVNRHTTSLYSKLNVFSRAAATRYAHEHDLL